MNKKIYLVVLTFASLNALSALPDPDTDACNDLKGKYKYSNLSATKKAEGADFDSNYKRAQDQCALDKQAAREDAADKEKAVAADKQKEKDKKAQDAANEANVASDKNSVADPADECQKYVTGIDTDEKSTEKAVSDQAIARQAKYKYQQCRILKRMSLVLDETEEIQFYGKKFLKQSVDGKISCIKKESITADYKECETALSYYNVVVNSETFMNLEQQVRTDVKTANINKDATKKAAQGDSQGAMFDSAEATNKHMKQMETEKAVAYSAAVAALGKAMYALPSENDVLELCVNSARHDKIVKADLNKNCQKTLEDQKPIILANRGIKGPLWEAIAAFTAKGIAAGIKMKQYGENAQNIAKAKTAVYDDGTDMMVDLCTANAADPACIQQGSRVSNTGTFGAGDLSFGGDGSNNVFGVTPGSGEFGETGADTALGDKNSVAGINSPFKDDAKRAKGILNPAAAAQTQAGAPAAGGGAGGGGGGGGGGSASLGGDLNGADPDGDKEAQIKTGKVSGSYGSVGGGGYKGLGKGKDDSNPFASLFDQKGGGGVEEDRSIASGDIDGKASGLFEKISKRYGQVQADKRVESKNLE